MPIDPSAVRCVACGSSGVAKLIDFHVVPVDTNRIWRSSEEARTAPKARMELAWCSDCGHLFDRMHNDDLVSYETDYENSQMFSGEFRKHAEEVSDRLITRYGIRRKRVIEIGGGKGDFLRVICERGENTGVSFGPSYRPTATDNIPRHLRFVSDYYTPKYADEPADIIICRHVLEHLSAPGELVTSVRRAVGKHPDIAVYFEVPNGDYIFGERAFWEFHYQHCSYFTAQSLSRLFESRGFRTRALWSSFGDQYLSIEAVVAEDGTTGEPMPRRTALLDAGARTYFSTSLQNQTKAWGDRLASLRAKGRRIIAWGAGAKAVTFLNIVDPQGEAISHIVDINPRKTGSFVPGAGQEIVPPNAVQTLRPDMIVLMNGIYRDEITASVAALGLHPEFVVA
jgi:hypothetical protein